MIWLTSDTHFGHDKEFLYKPRGFNSILKHDEAIIKNWNEVVDDKDIVYHLGDVMLNDNEYGLECLKRLKGSIYILPGNHDTKRRIELYKANGVNVLGFTERLEYKKYTLYLSHYPTLTSNLEGSSRLREHVINLFGHTHQTTIFYNEIPFMYHVGLDSHNCFPVSIDKAIEDMKAEVIRSQAML